MKLVFLLLALVVVSFTDVSKAIRCGALERTVREKSGNQYCKACIPCPAGEETNPPCDTDILYDEDNLNESCKVCDDGYYKEVTEREKKSIKKCLLCRACENHVVVSPCNKTHGQICGKRCRDGYVDSGLGICVPSSISERPVITSNSSASPEATQPATANRVKEPTKKTTPGSYKSSVPQSTGRTLVISQRNERTAQGHRKCMDNSDERWKWAAIGLIIFLLLALPIVCYKFYKMTKKLKRTNRSVPPPENLTETRNADLSNANNNGSTNSAQPRNLQQANTDNHTSTSFIVGAQNGNIGEEVPLIEDSTCCYCEEWAGTMLHEVQGIKQKICDLSKHFKDEKKVCNKLFDTISGTDNENNRIENTEDLYQKLYAEVDDVTVARFLRAFQTIGYRGVLEKIHDTFHHQPNLV